MAQPDLEHAPGGRNRDIEVLRAWAIILVVFHHLNGAMPYTVDWYWHLFRYVTFWGGVDLFFAISGYVIARGLIDRLRTAAEPSDRLRLIVGFWIRRVWRLYPAAWFWLSMMLVLSLAYNVHGSFGVFRNNFGDAVAAIAQVANLHFYDCSRTSPATCGYNGRFWSLSLEEQFYLVLPLLLLTSRRWYTWALLLLLVTQVLWPRDVGDLAWFFRTDALVAGVLIAIAEARGWTAVLGRACPEGRRIGPAVAIGLLLLVVAIPSDANRLKISIVPIGTGLLAVACAFLVFIAHFDRGYIWSDGKLKTLFVFVGQRAYSIYLSHPIAFLLVKESLARLRPPGPVVDHVYTTWVVAASLVLAGILAECSYRLIEAPCREYGRGVSTRFEADSQRR